MNTAYSQVVSGGVLGLYSEILRLDRKEAKLISLVNKRSLTCLKSETKIANIVELYNFLATKSIESYLSDKSIISTSSCSSISRSETNNYSCLFKGLKRQKNLKTIFKSYSINLYLVTKYKLTPQQASELSLFFQKYIKGD